MLKVTQLTMTEPGNTCNTYHCPPRSLRSQRPQVGTPRLLGQEQQDKETGALPCFLKSCRIKIIQPHTGVLYTLHMWVPTALHIP